MRNKKKKAPRRIIYTPRLLRLVAMNFNDKDLKESFVKILPIQRGDSIAGKVLFRLYRRKFRHKI